MAKEITLKELAAANNKQKPKIANVAPREIHVEGKTATVKPDPNLDVQTEPELKVSENSTTQEVVEIKPEPQQKIEGDGIKEVGHVSKDIGRQNLSKVDIGDIVQNNIKTGKFKPVKEEIKDAPVVANAFQSMDATLAERKRRIDAAAEKVSENLQEMIMEEELGEADYGLGIANGQLNAQDDEPESNVVQKKELTEDDLFAELEEDSNEKAQPYEPEVSTKAELKEMSTSDFAFDTPDKDEEDPLDFEDDSDDEGNDNPPEEVSGVSTEEKMIELDSDTIKSIDMVTEEALKPEIEDNSVEDVALETNPVQEDKPEDNSSEPVEKVEPEVVSSTVNKSDDDSAIDKLIQQLDRDEQIKIDDDLEETTAEIREKFKKVFKEVPINQDPIDFNKFTIKKKPVSSSFILNQLQHSMTQKRADWALYHTKRPMRFIECLGPELDTLRKTMTNSNNINQVIASLKFIYDHVDDAKKPPFEAWCKLIRTEDVDSMYYGIYKACYGSSNLIARTCPSETCKKTSLIETNIDDMVKYGTEEDKPEEIKKQFKKILNSDTTTESNSFKATLNQISDSIVISYSPASLYSTFLQFATLKDEITNQYSDLLNMMVYIDNFFFIDRQNNELVPIAIKEYPGSLNKTVLSRLKVFREILKSLTNDQYNVLVAKLNTVVEDPKISYVLPKVVCPECGAEIPEAPVDRMLDMLFLRAALSQVKAL